MKRNIILTLTIMYCYGGLIFFIDYFSLRYVGLFGLLFFVIIKYKINIYEFLILFILILICINNIFILDIKDISENKYYLRNIVLIFAVYIFFKSILDRELAKNFLNISFYLIILCSLFNILIYSIYDLPHFKIAEILNHPSDFLKKGSRLFFPFGTPPVFSYVVALLLLASSNLGYSLNKKIILIFLLILSASLSSIVPLIIILAHHFIFKNIKIKIAHLNLLFLIPVFLLIFSILDLDLEFRTFENIFLSMERHFLVRSFVFDLSNYNILDILLGKGVGQFSYYHGAQYPFSFILLNYYENGLFGLIISFLWYLNFYKMFYKQKYIFFFIIISSNLYQLNFDPIFFILPLIISKSIDLDNDKNI